MDGGLLAPNPSLHALTTIQDHLRHSGSDVSVSLVVSVGAGISQIPDYSKIKMKVSNVLVPGMSIPVLEFFGHVVSNARHMDNIHEIGNTICTQTAAHAQVKYNMLSI